MLKLIWHIISAKNSMWFVLLRIATVGMDINYPSQIYGFESREAFSEYLG